MIENKKLLKENNNICKPRKNSNIFSKHTFLSKPPSLDPTYTL